MLDEAKAAIAGAAGKKILDQPVYAEFAFIRGPKSDRGNRFEGRGGNRRGRSTSPSRNDGSDAKPLDARIEA